MEWTNQKPNLLFPCILFGNHIVSMLFVFSLFKPYFLFWIINSFEAGIRFYITWVSFTRPHAVFSTYINTWLLVIDDPCHGFLNPDISGWPEALRWFSAPLQEQFSIRQQVIQHPGARVILLIFHEKRSTALHWSDLYLFRHNVAPLSLVDHNLPLCYHFEEDSILEILLVKIFCFTVIFFLAP